MVTSASELDALDRQIVMLLQQNGRMTNAALAEAVGLTATPMLARIRKLEQSDVIRGYGALVDAAKLGRPVLAYVHVTLVGHGLENHRRFIESVVELPEVLECHHIAGDEDFLLKVAMHDIAELEHFLLHRLSSSGAIERVKTTFVLSTAKHGAPIVPVAEGGDP
jgi:Lrp/AsnC family leucine-responsive transcriptional regulator